MKYRLAFFIWVANFALSVSVRSLRRHAEFRCDAYQAANKSQSRSFFEVLFKALVDGQRPKNIFSKDMVLLPRLPMANTTSGIVERLAPTWDHASEGAEMDEALSALDGIDLASNTSAVNDVNASSTHDVEFSKRSEESTSSSSLDAEATRVNASFEKIQCIFESMLSDHCGHLKSLDSSRRSSWESVCLDRKHVHDATDAYELMSAEERKYSRQIRHMTPVGHHTVELWNDNVQYKAILCMQMKLVDDGCLSSKEPRFSPPARSVKSPRLVRGLVDANKTRSQVKPQVKPLEKKMEIGTMSASKDDAAKLVSEELEAVRHIKQ